MGSIRFLSSSTVARTLQQRNHEKSILTLVVQSSSTIDWAVASHPAAPAVRLPTLQHPTSTTFAQVWESNSVGGLIVAWPVVKTSGRCGAQCGRVLYVLERLLEGVSAQHHEEPPSVCFYPSTTTQQAHEPEDAWGRVAAYGRKPPSGIERHVVGTRTHYDMTADVLWQKFQREQWPHLPLESSLGRRNSARVVGGTQSSPRDRVGQCPNLLHNVP